MSGPTVLLTGASRGIGHATVKLFEERGWLREDNEFFPHLARVAPYTEECAWVEEISSQQAAFHDYNFKWMQRLAKNNVPVVGHGLYHFPDRVYYNCGAVGENSFLITPAGELHRCGLVTDDTREKVGNLNQQLDAMNANYRKWREFSPFEDSKCTDCSYLPSCLGGCPHDQMNPEKKYGRASSCIFHKKFEDKIIAQHIQLMQETEG